MNDRNAVAAEVPRPLALGSKVGSYVLRRFLGQGGMATIFEGRHQVLNRSVAIKVMHSHVMTHPLASERFIREGDSLARIRHPNVVEILDVGVVESCPYLVMEYLEGESLEGSLARDPVMDASQAATVLLPIACALAAIHEQGVVHRDVKPDNILLALDEDGRVVPKLVDFGLAKSTHAGESGPKHTIAGTPHFMSPEQLRGATTLDARTDQYAFGITLYRVLTGYVPYDGPSIFSIAVMIESGGAVPPRTVRPSIPEALEAIVLKAMAVHPEDRYADMRALAQDLAPFANARAREAAERELGFRGSKPERRDDTGSTRTRPAISGVAPRAPFLGVASESVTLPAFAPSPNDDAERGEPDRIAPVGRESHVTPHARVDGGRPPVTRTALLALLALGTAVAAVTAVVVLILGA